MHLSATVGQSMRSVLRTARETCMHENIRLVTEGFHYEEIEDTPTYYHPEMPFRVLEYNQIKHNETEIVVTMDSNGNVFLHKPACEWRHLHEDLDSVLQLYHTVTGVTVKCIEEIEAFSFEFRQEYIRTKTIALEKFARSYPGAHAFLPSKDCTVNDIRVGLGIGSSEILSLKSKTSSRVGGLIVLEITRSRYATFPWRVQRYKSQSRGKSL